MENEISILEENTIRSKIHFIRGQQVMLDSDLAKLYGVETRRLNEQVKRNIERFPEHFCFQLTREEVENLKNLNLVMSQIATSRNIASNTFAGQEGGTRKLPFVFTEQGVAMLSAVLKSETADKMSV